MFFEATINRGHPLINVHQPFQTSKFWRNSSLKTLKNIQRNSFKSLFQDSKFYWNRTQKPPQTLKSPKSLKLNGSSLQSSKEFPSKSLHVWKIFKEHLKNNKSLTSSKPKIYCEDHLVYLSIFQPKWRSSQDRTKIKRR